MTILKSHTEIQLPYGLLGFEEVKNYLIVIKPHEAPFMWLQMLAGARKSFLLVSPFLVLPDYQPDILAADVEFLGLEDPTDAILLNICTIRGPGKATLNLRGPIVINRHTLVGKQCIPNNSAQFALNHPLPVS
jgi:flagellar assembly factor FliW